MKAYSALSGFYDRLMTDYNYSEMLGFILSEIGVKGKCGLSLADGTGKASIALSKAGAKMTASDFSPDMLREAMENAKAAGQSIIYTLGDLNAFTPFKAYDFIVAVCDGLNYLLPENRGEFFLAAYRSLVPGGKFIFDISSGYKLAEVLNNNTFFLDEDDLAYIFSNRFDKKAGKIDMSVTLFAREGDLFRRYEDDSAQYIHGKDELISAADKAGFTVRVLDGTSFGEPRADSERLLFVLGRI